MEKRKPLKLTGRYNAMATGIELIISSICNATFCEPIYDNPLKTEQLTRKQVEFQKHANDLNGKHLKIATYDNYPFSWVDKNNNGTLIGRGVAFTIVDILQEKFNFTFEVVVPEKNFLVGGTKSEDSLVGLVNSSAVDMVAAFLPSLVKIRKKVAFSYSLDEGVYMMMLKRPKESAAGSGLLAPFEKEVWYLILAAVLSYGPCITILTHLRAKLVYREEEHIKLSPSFWFVYGAFIKQGTSLSPDANTTRVLFATWWLFIILLSAFYTANLTAFLTLSKFTLDIENSEDLYKKNYRWVAPEGGAVEYIIKDPDEGLNYLNKMVTNGRGEFRMFNQDAGFLPLVSGGAVLIKESTSIDHLMYNDYLSKAREEKEENDRCTYVVAPSTFITIPRAFAYPIGSKLNLLFDPVFEYLLQAGIIRYLEHKDLPSTKICPLDLQSKDRRLRNSDLLMTYLIMAAGLAAAAAVFIGEIYLKRYIQSKFKEEGKGKRKKNASKKIRFKEMLESRPPPYESLFGKNSQYKPNKNTKTQIINGREYHVVDTVSGATRLIPLRTPSALLYQ